MRSTVYLSLVSIMAALACALAAGGCAGSPAMDDPACLGEKCDTPDDPPEQSCASRRADALSSGQRAYTGSHIRWACSDVAGVNAAHQDSRGQEYCEYFAIVQPPPASPGAAPPKAVDLGRKLDGGRTTRLDLPLDEEQVFWLEDHASDVVGQCVFTSWHQDVPGPLPACRGPQGCPEILGFPISAGVVRMVDSVNSNGAANDLVQRCFITPAGGDVNDTNDPMNDAYTRGCMIANANWGTEWRRSDPTICAAIMRLAECGCGVDGDHDGVPEITTGRSLADSLVPAQPTESGITLRGFPLGTWSSPEGLPPGCRHIDTGDGSRTLVTCDLRADDVLKNKTDPKGACRAKYGDDVVVHIPVPAPALACRPPAGGKYAGTCSATPWVL